MDRILFLFICVAFPNITSHKHPPGRNESFILNSLSSPPPISQQLNQASAMPLATTNHQNTLWVIHRFCCQKPIDLPYFLKFTAYQAARSHCFVFNPGFTNISPVKCDIFIKSSKSVKFRIEQTLDVVFSL